MFRLFPAHMYGWLTCTNWYRHDVDC